MKGDSGNVETGAFSPGCGSPVYITFAAIPELFTLYAAGLNEPVNFEPQVQCRYLLNESFIPVTRLNTVLPAV